MAVTYDYARGCTGGPTPGALAIRDHWTEVTGLPNYGIYNCRPVRGGRTTSIHSEGRAVDLGANAHNPAHRAQADRYEAFLQAHAVEFGVQLTIWNRVSTRAGRYFKRRYSGVNPHTDHIHAELNKHGAKTLTLATLRARWAAYTGGAAPAPAQTPKSRPGAKSYTVKPGDTLWAIAKDHGTTIAALRSVNPIDGDKLYPGQVLTITGAPSGKAPAVTRAARVMKLQAALNSVGESLVIDGDPGPKTRAAVGRHLIGWTDHLHAVAHQRGYGKVRTARFLRSVRNEPAMVRVFQELANITFGGAGVDLTVDGITGPATNHIIVVLCGQADGIAGPDGFARVCGA